MSSNLRDLQDGGLLVVGEGCRIDPGVRFEPSDLTGVQRPIVLGDRVTVGAGAILHGGTELGDGAVVEVMVTVGAPEYGYAMGHVLDGSGAVTRVGAGAVLRAHAYVYNGASVGDRTTVGHYTLLRTNVRIGKDSQLAHYIVAERGSSFGDRVRCSPLSHFTGDFVAEGDVFIGARVATINDKSMLWSKDPGDPHIVPPHVEKGARVGSGCTLASGVRIGEGAIVGSASFVNKDIPPHAVAFGSPARVRPELSADPAAIRRARS